MISAEKALVELLQEFGLSTNSAKTYLSLLNNNPATGYEICTQSGIPRSAIYSVLGKLEALGIVNSLGNAPKRYIPIPPASLLEHLDHLHSDRVGQLRDALDNLNISEEAFDFWHIHGYRNLVLKLREAVSKAKKKIFLSTWAKELVKMEKELIEADKKGIDITIFSFNKLPFEVGVTVTYNLDEKKLLEIWNPKIILVVDQEVTVMGSTQEHSKSRAIWTANKAITEIATNHIILDITLAGPRLKFDPNPVAKRLMHKPDLELDDILKQ
jgi:sugar-specific transcriptional regulator TrmB